MPTKPNELNADEARRRVEDHFGHEPAERVVNTARQLAPRLLWDNSHQAETSSVRQPLPPHKLPLNAYLACALTGLNTSDRDYIFHLSDTVSYICSEFDIDVYEPRKKTDPVHHPEVSDLEVFKTDRERVLGSDLLIHLCHHPSTGSGQELDFAYNALLPVMLIRHADKRASRMITGMPSLKVEVCYREPEELRAELRARLGEIKPMLEERKLSAGSNDENVVGARVRALREAAQLSLQDVADATGFTPEGIALLESTPDFFSNPSLLQLRRLATVLRTTAAELIAPDLSPVVLSELQSWLEGRQAARSPHISPNDQRRIVRRILLRVIDQLEHTDQ